MIRMKLLFCPFCGCTEIDADGSDTTLGQWALCTGCGASSASRQSYEEVEKLWNRRVEVVIVEPTEKQE